MRYAANDGLGEPSDLVFADLPVEVVWIDLRGRVDRSDQIQILALRSEVVAADQIAVRGRRLARRAHRNVATTCRSTVSGRSAPT